MVFSGSGGQGVITAAIILAEAAVLCENLIAVQSQSYGPEAKEVPAAVDFSRTATPRFSSSKKSPKSGILSRASAKTN